MIKTLSIHGFRSYSKETLIDFSHPNGEPGGGLTVFVGANNSGKTTAIEALQFFNSSYNRISFFRRKKCPSKPCGSSWTEGRAGRC